MPDTNTTNVDQTNDNTDQTNTSNDATTSTTTTGTVDVTAQIQAGIDEALKDIKAKLDKAYGARDEALAKIKTFEQKEREAELKRLQDEGKHKEAFEMQLAEERAAREALEKRNVELTRDLEVKNALAGYELRNDKAFEMAYREVTDQLVRNEQGVWVHKSGVTIKDFLKTFAENSDNSFLFKAKVSTGGGSSSTKTTSTSTKAKSLFELSQAEVLQMAREGKLPGRK
jgi:hypothetical protein